jgi:hypothetical protein
LSTAQKLLVGTGGAAILSLPVCLGLLLSPIATALVATTTGYSPPTGAARQDYLQTRPQKEIAFDPKDFDRFQGYYAFAPMYFAHVFRTKDRYYIKLTDQAPREIFPESPTEFFATLVAMQVSFVDGADGRVTGLVLHRDAFSLSRRGGRFIGCHGRGITASGTHQTGCSQPRNRGRPTPPDRRLGAGPA